MSSFWSVTGKPPADQVADAKAMQHAGMIAPDGFAQPEAKALMSRTAPKRRR